MKHIKTIARYATIGLIALAAVAAKAANVEGEWTWTPSSGEGLSGRPATLTLKLEGEKLRGTLAAPGSDGKVVETPISDATLEGDSLTFYVVREVGGVSYASRYSGKVSDDKITGKVENTKSGQSETQDWEAKRVVAAEAPKLPQLPQ
ncbi:MAG: hypothetical protein KIT22_06160 [Verrucomicrobiae bacterium]|nr:hypothetical protein [Verrucomicrobiae bacterium]